MTLKRTLVFTAAGLCLLLPPLSAPSSAEDTLTAEAAFERAETLFRQLEAVDAACADVDSWEALAAEFAVFPERYSTHPLAGDALWRLAEIRVCEFEAGHSRAAGEAEAAYELLVTRYPSSRYAPRAYLRLGELSVPQGAQTHYYRLLQRYPGSSEAAEARRRLAQGPAVEDPADRPVMTTEEVLEAPPTPASTTSSSVATQAADPVVPELDPAAEEADPAMPEADFGDAEFGRLLGVRHYSDAKHTRVVFDLDGPLQYEIGEAQGPPRVFVDLIGATLPPGLERQLGIDGPGIEGLRLGVNRPGVVRAVLDLRSMARYSFFSLGDPHRLVIDIPSPELSERLAGARRPASPDGGAEGRQLSLGIRRVVIDPGHGGSQPGAIGRSGLSEKELTMDISRRLAANLRQSGYDVMLTREDDATVPLESRPQMATARGADLFVSVHVNASTNRTLSGFETYYLDLATDPTAAETAARENAAASTGLGDLDDLLGDIVRNANKRESRDLAHSIQDSLVLQMNKHHDDIRDLGVKHAPFIVLVGAAMPAVLVECSFVSHPQEEERLRTPEYRQQLADAIHIGIENYAAKRRMISSSH